MVRRGAAKVGRRVLPAVADVPLLRRCGVQSVCFLGHNPIALVPNPRDFDDLVKTIETTKPAVFCGVPTLYNALLNTSACRLAR